MIDRIFRHPETAAGLTIVLGVMLAALAGVAYAAATGYQRHADSQWRRGEPLERCRQFRYQPEAAAECVRGILRIERLRELRETCSGMRIGADECIREVVRAELGIAPRRDHR